jgi:PAS domain-containing protein
MPFRWIKLNVSASPLNSFVAIGYLRLVLLIFSVVVFSLHIRASELQMRSFLRSRDETSVLTKLVSILRCLPDGIFIADVNQGPLYFNQRVKHLLQLFEEDEDA